jgi:acetoin utilization deacetylase AcuC-like enzyme
MTRTGFVWEELFAWHDTGTAALVIPPSLTVQPGVHAENAETKRRFAGLIEVSGLLKHLVRVEAVPAEEDDICRCHTREYVKKIQQMSGVDGGDAGELTPFGRGGYEIALLSAGACIQLARLVMDGKLKNGYALNRPPGHHAEANAGRGFCIFCNGAIAVKHIQAEYRIVRVAVVDWDVHHGNGTQAAFYDDPSVLTISIHQNSCFPIDSGHMHENGQGRGLGANINIPLPPGSGHGAYLHCFDQVVVPALEAFNPEIIFVLSGFDASGMDPLGRMCLYSDTYRELTRKMMAAAEQLCGGRLVMCHEGGYSPAYVPYCGLAVLEELSGVRTGVVDPFLPLLVGMGEQALQPHQAAVIARARGLLSKIPSA